MLEAVALAFDIVRVAAVPVLGCVSAQRYFSGKEWQFAAFLVLLFAIAGN
jgi:hypothetical protein